ncbi:heat-inducible transcription repressor [Perilla frutescens var. hirtella]|uniref:Heat-inducible transcription repressor n=1 Tax=Perilla frutescens var. hirtella TaxID=608512 RepID=A0AAD4IPD8_PERFH|nr:heat-inducible transcription repressor [Perilla frutescens var. hirtella]
MNFLMLRSNNSQPSVNETQVETNYAAKPAGTLEGLIAEDPFPESTSSETRYSESDDFGNENGMPAVPSGKNNQVDSHIDVTEDNGLIVIPCREVPDNWMEASDILSFSSLDRSFVFPGEQIRILACLSAYKQDTEIITPFKVAALMNKTGIGKSSKKQNGNIEGEAIPVPETIVTNSGDQDNQLDGIVAEEKIDSRRDVSTGESLLRMEDHKRQTEQLLRRFENSHFFVRIAEANEPLWSKRRVGEVCSESSTAFEEQLAEDFETSQTTTKKKIPVSASVDRGKFDSRTSGGLARGAVKCCSLSNGDIVVLLQVNVGIQFLRDPTLEILQFEKHQDRNLSIKNQDIPTSLNQDPYGQLLKWLLPLDNSIPPPVRPSPPPTLSSSSSIKSASVKPAVPSSSSSQLFSFGHFRSYSMSSLPPNATPPAATPPAATPPAAVRTPDTQPTLDPEYWNQFSFKKFVGSGKSGNEGLLSFRGVPLQQERFSVRCGLEGIFTPGRRWRRKIELIQPVEIRSFSVDCNTDDLLCVHVKNVSPAHAPDIVVFIDSITIIFEEASKGGPPLFLPIACIESGNNYSLPNLALRRGEEHSFVLKPATALWKHGKGHSDGNPRVSRVSAGSAASSWVHSNPGAKHNASPDDQFAVLVSCRCNYTESKLFFKQPTSWRPRISRDLVISVASEMSRQALGSDGTQLPVQILTLQASNMTSEDLTLTVLAPASFTSPPSVVSLSNSPSSPMSPFSASTELASDRQAAVAHGQSSVSQKHGHKVEDGPLSVSVNEQTLPMPDGVPLGCSHLWLQSRVPLGCVPSQSTATVKLEVLPLTDGIITLDSLQVEVREKGLTYVPEQSLKINATSSIATAIL